MSGMEDNGPGWWRRPVVIRDPKKMKDPVLMCRQNSNEVPGMGEPSHSGAIAWTHSQDGLVTPSESSTWFSLVPMSSSSLSATPANSNSSSTSLVPVTSWSLPKTKFRETPQPGILNEPLNRKAFSKKVSRDDTHDTPGWWRRPIEIRDPKKMKDPVMVCRRNFHDVKGEEGPNTSSICGPELETHFQSRSMVPKKSKNLSSLATVSLSPSSTPSSSNQSPRGLSSFPTRMDISSPPVISSSPEGLEDKGSGMRTRSKSRIDGSDKETFTGPLSTKSSTLLQTSTEDSNVVAQSSTPVTSSGKKGKKFVIPTKFHKNGVNEEEDLGRQVAGSVNESNGEADDDTTHTLLDNNAIRDKTVSKKTKMQGYPPLALPNYITVLEGNPPTFKCKFCRKKIKAENQMSYHQHCNKRDRPFLCEYCGRVFTYRSRYQCHLRTHTGERLFTCSQCNKGFIQEFYLARHMHTHTGERPFICSECSKGFVDGCALKAHMLIHTGLRPFECQECQRRFVSKQTFKSHMMLHAGERPHACTSCDKRYINLFDLNKHRIIHTGKRPFVCTHCGKDFCFKSRLDVHLKTHFKERSYKR